MSVCVIHNPTAGRRRASLRMRRLRHRWDGRVDFWPTSHEGHGTELARQAVREGYTIIAAAGGDGTVHEVANGLLSATADRATNAQPVTLAVVPVGSANDFAYSLGKQFGTTRLDDDAGHRVDVGEVSTPDGRRRFFVESVGMGLAGMVTHESRSIDRSQGLMLYGRAAWRVLKRDDLIAPLRLTFDDRPVCVWPTLLLSLLLGQREGNFLFAPQASLDDGQFEVLHAGPLTRWQALSLIPRLALHGPPTEHPQLAQLRCRSLDVIAVRPLTIHTDGELFCLPADDVRQVSIRLLPQRLRVKLCTVY